MELTYESCWLCPRSCHVNRHQQPGFCNSPATIHAARAALHPWEEPCISGLHGSGTIFFTGCTLRCCYCQNYSISQQPAGIELTPQQLSDIMLRLQDEGAHNINLVTATQYLPEILRALDIVRHRLTIPVVYNCGGYEQVETIKVLSDYINIWLPDLKYYDSQLSQRYSAAVDYFLIASQAIRQMIAQTGSPSFQTFQETLPDGRRQECQLMKSGVIIRHMILPGQKEDSIRLLHWIAEYLPANQYYISLLSQYTPFYHRMDYPEINRRITSYEYQKVVDAALALGLKQGFMQEKSSAKEEYTPPFDLTGLEF